MNTKQLSRPLYRRTALPLIQRYAQIYPAIGLNGPRQSGKTTLAKEAFPHLPYVSLENIDTQLKFNTDPRGFLAMYSKGAIFDEVQHTPTLLSYLQEILDSSPLNGRFVITGSQNFTLNSKITQSLAGRIGQVTLLPLSYSELNTPLSAPEYILRGSYPRLHYNNMTPHEFYPLYINTYIERDVRQLKQIADLSTFKKFLKLCAGRTGQLLNINSLAQDCSIDHKTAQGWLSILEASYIIFLLQPYHNNFKKRLKKMPKLYFYDTGLAASLLGIYDNDHLATHYAQGALFENLIVTEIMKSHEHRGHQYDLSFWRDNTGKEIDLIDHSSGRHKLIEIKSSHTVQANDLKHLTALAPLFDKATQFLVYGNTQSGTFGGATLLSLETLDELLGATS